MSFVRPVRDGVKVAVRLTPNAGREQVIGFDTAGQGDRCRIAVTAPPVDGRANTALLKFLAKQWCLPKSALSVAAGTGARDKVVHVAGDPELLLIRIRQWQEETIG